MHRSWWLRGVRRKVSSTALAGAYLPGAHHPHCDRYYHHLIWVARRPLCLGCTSVAVGALLGFLSLAVVPWTNATVGDWILAHLILLVPTAVQPWLQRKLFKIVARGLLGAAAVSYWVSGALLLGVPLPKPVWFVLMLVAFGIAYQTLRRLRTSRKHDPCASCPEGVYPTCNWNLPRLLAQTEVEVIDLNALRSNLRLISAASAVITRRRG